MRIRTIDGALATGLLLQFAVGMATLGWVASSHFVHDGVHHDTRHAREALVAVSLLAVVPVPGPDGALRLGGPLREELDAIASHAGQVQSESGQVLAGEIRRRLDAVGQAQLEGDRGGWTPPQREEMTLRIRGLASLVHDLARRLDEEAIQADEMSDRAMGLGLAATLLAFILTAALVLRRIHEPAAAITQALRRYTETRVLEIPPVDDLELREIATALEAMDRRLRETTVSLERLQGEVVERERAQSALRGLAERVPGVIYQYRRDPAGRDSVPYASERLRELLGIERESLQQGVKPLIGLIHPDDREAFAGALANADQVGGTWRHEFRVEVPGRGVRHLLAEAIEERRLDGTAIWNGYLQDVTEARAAAERLRQAELRAAQSEKLSAIGTMVGGVSHEINNPLMAAMGFVAAARQEMAEGEGRRMLLRAQQELDRIARIVRSMLIFVRTGRAARVEVVDVASAVRRVEDILRLDPRMRGVAFRAAVPEDLPAVRCPEGTLDQALLNLVRNAGDATSGVEGGREVALSARADGDFVEIEVTDNGPGVAPEDVTRLFQPFFTTKAPGEGTGLGLSVTRHMVEVAGGSVQYLASDRGARFACRLPAQAPGLQ